MKKIALTLLLVLTGMTGLEAQILWKISGNGLDRPSYLLGTHHVAPLSVLDSLPGFPGILASVDKVYGEMDMALAQSPAGQQTMAMAAMAPADSTLSRVVTPAQADSLTVMLQRYMGPQVSAAAFEPLRPAMVSTLIAMVQTQTVFPDFKPENQLDGVIQERAKALGKEVGGLETIDEQCAILFGGSIASQVEDLLDAVRNEELSLSMARKLADAYMAGDLNAILEIVENPELSSPESTERLINKRNADWLRVIAAMLPTASVLIAVGAGHLPGEKGLISMLREKGYTVEKV